MYAIVIAHYKIEMDMGHGATRNRMLYFSTIQRLCWHCDEHDLETLISWSRRYPCKEIAVERSKTGLYPYILWQRNVSICVVENRQMAKKQINRKFVVTSERCESSYSPFYSAQRKSNKPFYLRRPCSKHLHHFPQTDMNIVTRREKGYEKRIKVVEQHEVRADWNSSPFPLR